MITGHLMRVFLIGLVLVALSARADPPPAAAEATQLPPRPEELLLKVPTRAWRSGLATSVRVRLEDPASRSFPPTQVIGFVENHEGGRGALLWRVGLESLLWGGEGSDLPLRQVRRLLSLPFCINERAPAAAGLVDITGDGLPEVIVGGHSGYGHYGYFGVTYIFDLAGQPLFKGVGTETCVQRPGALTLQPLPGGGLQALPPPGKPSPAPRILHQWNGWGFVHPQSARVSVSRLLQEPSSFHKRYVILHGDFTKIESSADAEEFGIADAGGVVPIEPWFPLHPSAIVPDPSLSPLRGFLGRPVEAAGRVWTGEDGRPLLDATAGWALDRPER